MGTSYGILEDGLPNLIIVTFLIAILGSTQIIIQIV